jgi:hypothetical protein
MDLSDAVAVYRDYSGKPWTRAITTGDAAA